jgi:hypothetical protein
VTDSPTVVVSGYPTVVTEPAADQEPIYAEISEIRSQNCKDDQKFKICPAKDASGTETNKATAAAVAMAGGEKQQQQTTIVCGGSEWLSRGGEKSGRVVYGLITAKQAAKFVPCNQTLIVRH